MPDHPDPGTPPPSTRSARQPTASGWILGGRYRVIDRLGRGGMAEVFRAHDELLERDVAVKVFRTMDAPDDDNAEARRELELQSLARLSHPNLITLFDGSVAGDGPAFLVLELVPGADLASRLSAGPLPEPEAREIGAQIADALGYVHAHGMVHRDVKPANILVGVDDAPPVPGPVRARLSDFGVVRIVDRAPMTAANLTLGTASYVAPEQARGSAVGPAADVYSLGLVLIEALTGVRSFDGSIHEAMAARSSSAPLIPASLPAPWPGLLAAMTELDPAARPEAKDVARSLHGSVTRLAPPLPTEAAVAGAPGAPAVAEVTAATVAASAGASPPVVYAPSVDEPIDPRGPRRPNRAGPLVLAGLAVVAIALGAGFLLLQGSPNSPGGAQPTTSTTSVRSGVTPTRTSGVSPAADVQGQPTADRSSKRSVPSRSERSSPAVSRTRSSTPADRTSAPSGRSTSSSPTASSPTSPGTSLSSSSAASGSNPPAG